MANGKLIFTDAQINFLLSKEVKGITPSVAGSFSADDGYEAFKAIRWGWTGGKAVCIRCGHERLYEFATRRGKFKCAKCGDQFSVTTKTAFTSRKMQHKTYVQAIAQKLHRPGPIMDLAHALEVNYRTAWRLNSLLAFLGGNVAPKTTEARWPFLPQKPLDGTDIVSAVDKAIPRSVPEQVRADVAQEIILGVLEGEITLEQVATQAKKYLSRLWREYDSQFSFVSLDRPIPGSDGRSWHDILGEDRSVFA